MMKISTLKKTLSPALLTYILSMIGFVLFSGLCWYLYFGYIPI